MKATFLFPNSPVLPLYISNSRRSLSFPPIFPEELRRSQLHAVSGTTQTWCCGITHTMNRVWLLRPWRQLCLH